MSEELINLTADIVAAHVSNNRVNNEEVATLIADVYQALAATTVPVEEAKPAQEPAVSVRASIRPDYIVCLEDGAKLKMLKRYLRTRYDMSPEEYRAKWNLPRDYPMVAPNYASQRAELAKKIGLGRKAAEEVLAEPDAVVPSEKKPRGRPKKLTGTEALAKVRGEDQE